MCVCVCIRIYNSVYSASIHACVIAFEQRCTYIYSGAYTHMHPGEPQRNSKNVWWRSFHYQPLSPLQPLARRPPPPPPGLPSSIDQPEQRRGPCGPDRAPHTHSHRKHTSAVSYKHNLPPKYPVKPKHCFYNGTVRKDATVGKVGPQLEMYPGLANNLEQKCAKESFSMQW